MSGFRIEPLAKHDRTRFSCGSEPLDRYFKDRTTQDARRRISSCFVAVPADGGDVAGFYTLAATSLALDQLSPDHAKKLPRYPLVPAVLLGRLAVATTQQGHRLGMTLLADAILRASRSDVTGHILIVDAKDEVAVSFYKHFGFEQLVVDRMRLIRRL
jgi:GNAT superfamily N-acetyltransferase